MATPQASSYYSEIMESPNFVFFGSILFGPEDISFCSFVRASTSSHG